MKRKNFEGICKVAQSGKIKWVDNLESNRPGRVISCDAEGFEVEFKNQHRHWDYRKCQERTYGYRPVYQ